MSLAILVCILAAAPVRAGQKPTNNTKVTSVVYDYDTAGQQLLTQSDHFNGSQQATYGAADWRVSSLVLTGSAWQVYLGNQSVRTGSGHDRPGAARWVLLRERRGLQPMLRPEQ